MLIPLKKLQFLLRDPIYKSDLIFNWDKEKLKSISNGKINFNFCNDIPILIDFEKSIFEKKTYNNLNLQSSFIGKRSIIKKKIKNLLSGSIFNSKKNLNIFKSNLPSKPTVLIIGGGSIGTGMNLIYKDKSIDLISTDVYPSNIIQFISDSHNLPIRDSSVDGVIIQAVLEHVLNPQIVVDEIKRVLKKDGIVFAETPFMQGSHEEPYDFNRFTELGHRWLFKSFDTIYRNSNGGPGLSLYWSIKNFIFSILNSKLISNIISLPFIILSFMDFIIPEKRKIKNANGFIFIGKKREKNISESEIIKHYIGS